MAEQSRAATGDGASPRVVRRHRPLPAQPLRVLKLYDVVRTAHLERVRPDVRTTILYVSHRYDFDRDLAAGVDLRRAGIFGTLLHAIAHDVDVIEINEPLIARAAPRALAAAAGNRIRSTFSRSPRARVVSYAIANKDPRTVARSYAWKQRVKWRLHELFTPLVWRRVDRLAFGTEGARDLYRQRFPSARSWPTSRTVIALPSRRSDVDLTPRDRVVAFLGDLSPRKGLPQLLAAWPLVARTDPTARLIVIGKGIGKADVERLADEVAGVELVIDPPRDALFSRLAGAKVLVLASQPSDRWREQVGLPIVEGLSVGCEIVTTPETGLASWLQANGHAVLSSPDNPDELAAAILRAVGSSRSPADIVAPLPLVDGRRAADDWLIAQEEEAP